MNAPGFPSAGGNARFHLAALCSILVWSSTYLFTKVLVLTLKPIEISFFRFIAGFLFLCLLKPPRPSAFSLKRDGYAVLAGFLGIFLYYFLENSAAVYTYASNVAFIVSLIPVITSILSPVFERGEKPGIRPFVSFLIAGIGMTVIRVSRHDPAGLSLRGDLLALGAAFAFSLYSLVSARASRGTDPTEAARNGNGYGLVFICALYLATPGKASLGTVLQPGILFRLLYLGLTASGLCFLLWNTALRGLGAAGAGRYIYLVPVCTGLLSLVFLGEPLRPLTLLGMAIIVSGLLYSGGGRHGSRPFRELSGSRRPSSSMPDPTAETNPS